MNALCEERVGGLLRGAGWTLAAAESCTGGLIAHRITNVPGSSDYFLGSVVSYSNEAKERILGVSGATLERYGAVSEQAAREMAAGARRLFGADIAISATGIAGPGGGTSDKPVGLVHLALSAQDAEWHRRFVWLGDRAENKESSADAALSLLLEYLETRRAAGQERAGA